MHVILHTDGVKLTKLLKHVAEIGIKNAQVHEEGMYLHLLYFWSKFLVRHVDLRFMMYMGFSCIISAFLGSTLQHVST